MFEGVHAELTALIQKMWIIVISTVTGGANETVTVDLGSSAQV